MKFKLFFLLPAILFFTEVKGQEEKSPTALFLYKWGYIFPDSTGRHDEPDSTDKWPDTLYFNTVYKTKLLGSPTIPISFSRIELIDGKYQVSPVISLGYGYTWFTGTFVFNETDKIMVDPRFYFGAVADVSLQNDFSFNKLAGFFTGVFIGFGNFSLFMGYDYVTGSPSVSIGGRIDVYTFHQLSLNPIGKVRESRRHKTGSLQIRDE
jgi:hypothetical protein